MNLAQKVFSIKNDERKTHKIITIGGIKLKVKSDGIQKLKQKIEDYKIMHDKSLYAGIPEDITLQLAFNNDCNCQCKFCANYKETVKKREVIPAKWLYEYLEPIYKNTKNLITTYGEITHGNDGYEYISYMAKHHPEINVFIETNGIAFNQKWRELAAENLLEVKFSINAIDEESFKKTVWEKDGLYTLIHNNIQEYINLLDKKGLSSFRPFITTILNSTNYQNVEAFIKMGLKWKITKIGFLCDNRENDLTNLTVKDRENFEKALNTLVEIEKLLKDKVYIGFRLFLPIKNLDEYEKKVSEIPIEVLKEKYSEIWDLAKDLNIKNTYLERVKIYKEKNKKLLTYFEFLRGVCWHSQISNGRTICSNPWNHIRLKSDGKLEVCAWRRLRETYKIQQFIDKDKIDFKKLFNDLYHRRLRQNFLGGGYTCCMKTCPARENLSQKEFEEKYSAQS